MLLSVLAAVMISAASCKKNSASPKTSAPTQTAQINNGPYGDFSRWQGIGGDSLFKEELTLTLFYTEESSPCDICHYHLNYSLWDDYTYTYSTSKCTVSNDTLMIKDIATAKKAFFKRIK